MANYKRHAAALLLALAVAGGAAGCGAPSAATEAPTQDAPVSETTQPPAWTAWDPVAVTTNAAGERCFALSAQTFLQRYNTLWAADWGEDLLPALEEWTDYDVGTLSRNGGLEGRQYQTRQDPTNFAEPFLALCLTQTGDQVMEVVAGNPVSAQGPVQPPGVLPGADGGRLPDPLCPALPGRPVCGNLGAPPARPGVLPRRRGLLPAPPNRRV